MKRFIISFLVLFTILNINAQNNNLKFLISEPKVISQVGIPFQGYWPDGKFCFLPEENGDGWVCYWGEGDTFRTKARTTLLEDHIASNGWQTVIGRDVNRIEGFNDGGSWMIGIRRLKSGKLVGFFHAESWWSNDGTAFKSIGVTYSSDNGMTWEQGKRILAPSYSKPQEPAWVGLGDGCVVWNANRQQYICYYQEVEAGGICMAASSDPDGAPGTWKKWDGEDFTLEGCNQETQIGGRPVLIEGLKSVCGSSPSVMWNDYLQKWMMVYTKWGGDIYLSLSIDGIDWSVPILILTEPIKPLYPNLVSEEGDLVGGKRVRLYYSKDQQENGIRQLAYREIEFYENIAFADANVKAICVANWDINSDGELSDTEAMSVTDLGVVFKGNTNITSFDELRYFTGLTKITNNAFQGCMRLTSIFIPNNVETIGESSFESSGLTNITIPNNITTIGSWAFQGCENIVAITLPESVNYIGGAAFAYSPKLASINLPSQLREINEWMFTNCFALKSIDIPENVITINKRCFYGSGLTSITIPHSVTSIGESAFENCNSLNVINARSNTPPSLYGNSFSTSTTNNAKLLVPIGSVELYKTAEGWKNFSNINSNSFKLRYELDNEIYKTVEMEYDETITPEPAPIKEGYTFSGWSNIPATMPAHNVTVIGSFTVNKYKLTYMVDGQVYKTMDVGYGTKITSEPLPTKEGHTFSGWSEIPATMPAHDVTVTGLFTVNKYLLTYIVDGQEYKTYEVEYGAAITPVAEPTKEGYTFSGWSEIPATMPAHDVTVNGTFSKGSYKLIYMVDGKVYKTVTYDYEATITPEAAPAKEGYTFSGWSGVPATMPAKDVTITGTFTINKYKLTYMVDGTVYKSYEIEYSSAITPEAEPTKEGYIFSGWSDIPATMPAKDVIVNGSFSKGSYKLTYMIDGEVYKTITYDYGASITPEASPTKEGYSFSGWSGLPKTMPAEDVTVTGMFTINKYKLTYMVDGTLYKSYEVEYGSTITPEAEPTKEGYTFSGWSDIPATMPAKDVTITGTFSVNKYKLAYMVDGEVYKSFEIEYGTSITPEAEPVKEGYTFSGWSWIPKKMPDEDVTVSGYFIVNKYKLTYMIGDEMYKEVEIEYGSTIPTEPQPDGDYVRFEWVGVPETMPAHDVIVYADFETGIMDAMALHGVRYIYSPNGKRISKLQKGVNIVVMNDGSVKKVYVK